MTAKNLISIFGLVLLLLLGNGAIAAPLVVNQIVSDAPQTVSIEGVIVDGGIICPLIELTDGGGRVPLMGVSRLTHPPGTRLKLVGSFVSRSPCQQGTRTFRVTGIQAAFPPSAPLPSSNNAQQHIQREFTLNRRQQG